MTLAETSIRRPVLAIVVSVLIVLFGAVGFTYLGVREYPALDPPIVTVTTTYPGASPDVIASQITEPLEQNISGASGIRVISSTSREGESQIKIEFDLSVEMEAAANDVRDKVSIARKMLPLDVDPPVVEKADADAQPIVFMTVRSETKSIYDVAYIADTLIKERVQTIPGVSTVRIFGDKRYAIRLLLDPARMSALRVTPGDVEQAVLTQNVDRPAGRLEGRDTDIGLRTSARLTTPDEFNRLTIRTDQGRTITLQDVGRAVLSAEDVRSSLKSSGVPMIGVAVIPQPNTNAIAIADEFYRRLEGIKKVLPPEYTAEIGFDFTTYVRSSIAEVEETLLIAFGLVALIIFVFLRDFRATIIPVIAIPVSIISAFFIMYVAGFTINILTLVGLVLAIGLVCDDAIVVLENIYTKIEQGQSPLQASLNGSREIYFAVISTTISLAAVFLPILFLDGITGRLFKEFGIVVAGSILVSAFVALTLSPMMCRFLLKHRQRPGRLQEWSEPFFRWLTASYQNSLHAFMRLRWLSIPVTALIAAYVFWQGPLLPQELAPLEDRANIRVNVRAPESAGFEFTAHQMDRVGAWVEENVPEVARSFSITGLGGRAVNAGTQNVYLKPPDQRSRSQAEIYAQMSKGLGAFQDIRVFPSQPPTIGSRSGGLPLQYVLQAPTVAELLQALPPFLEAAKARKELAFVDADFKLNREETSVEIDRERAAQLGVSVDTIAKTLQLSFGDRRLGYYVQNGKQYQIISQLDRPFRNEPSDLRDLYVKSNAGALVSLDNLISWKENVVPSAIYRYDRYVSATVSANMAEGYTLGDGITAMEAVAKKVLPQTIATTLAGEARDFADSSSSLLFAFLLALLVIYLVLAAQFESFVDPLIILLTVPLSLGGAILALSLTGSSLNIFSQIGIIMLVGLVTKNGILIVEFANQRRQEGFDTLEAVVGAASERFRPILMTSFATILGVLPIALSLGASAGSRQSLGIAVVGGLIGATGLSLYLVPALYSYLSRARAVDGGAETDEPLAHRQLHPQTAHLSE